MTTTWSNVLNGAATTVGATPGDAVPAAALADVLQISNSGAGLDDTLRDVIDGSGEAIPLQVSTSAVRLPEGVVWPYGDSTFFSAGQTGILIPYYLYPNNPYSDANATRLLGLIRQYRGRVPVIVILNPGSGPGSVWDGNYAAFIRLIQAAGGKVAGYVSTAYAGTINPDRTEAAVKADVDTWQALYASTPIDTIFFDEQNYDVGTANAYLNLYVRYTDYCHARNLAPVIANPGTNQQGAWFETRSADIIVVAETGAWPTESAMLGAYVGGHIDYKTSLRAALVYGQSRLDATNVRTLAKYVQWVYATDDALSPNPWDSLSAHLEETFALLADAASPTANVAAFGAAGDGAADDTAAFVAALATGRPVLVPKPSIRYRVTAALTLATGATLIGDGSSPTIRLDSASVAKMFDMTSVSGVTISGLTLDGNSSVTPSSTFIVMASATDCALSDLRISNAPGTSTGSILISGTSTGNRIARCTMRNGEGSAIGLSGAAVLDNTIDDVEIADYTFFGVRLGEGANNNTISRVRTTSNGIELVGITHASHSNRIDNCRAEGCGDNGFSMSGSHNVVTGCIARYNDNAGFFCWGAYNTIAGCSAISNNQSVLATPANNWPGFGVNSQFGGTGQRNVFLGCVGDDDQAVATQFANFGDTGNGYTLWANGTAYATYRFTYCYYGLNIYISVSSSGTSGATPPTHTVGDVTDGGIAWRYVRSFTTEAAPTGNVWSGLAGRTKNGDGYNYYTGAVSKQIRQDRTAWVTPSTLSVGGDLITWTALNQVSVVGTGNSGFAIQSGASSLGRLAFGDSAYAGAVEYDHGTDSMNLAAGATNRLFLSGSGNLGINGSSYGTGTKVVFIANASAVPSTNPSGGGVLYTESGALKYRGSSGTVTTIGPA